jgi:soluble lytic murein transglycosylase-like protein
MSTRLSRKAGGHIPRRVALSILIFVLILLLGSISAPIQCHGIQSRVDYWAGKYNLHPALVRAVIMVESRWKTNAVSYDARTLKKKTWTWDIALTHNLGLKDRLTWSSVGLMQVSTLVAYDLGFRSEPEVLFRTETNLKYGCARLAQCGVNAKTMRRQLWRYNQSTEYINAVMRKYDEYTRQRPLPNQ